MTLISQNIGRIPVELRVVIGLVCKDLGFGAESQIALTDADVSWEKVLELAELHGVLSIVYRGLTSITAIPDDADGAFRGAALQCAMRSLTFQSEVAKLAGRFDQGEVRYLAVKGHALAAQFYTIPVDRAMGDIDFLIHRDDIKRARAIVEQCSYRPMEAIVFSRPDLVDRYERSFGDFAYENNDVRCSVDLHTRMEHTPSLFPYSFDEVFALDQHVPVAGNRLRTLPEPLHLIYCAVHGAWHAWSRLKWLVDIAVILQKNPYYSSDDFLVNEKLRDLDLWRPVSAALYLSHVLFGSALPVSIANDIDRDTALRHIIDYALDSLMRAGYEEPKAQGFALQQFRVSLRARTAHKLEVVQNYMSWKDIDMISFPLPASVSFLYPYLSPLFFLARKIAPHLANPYHRAVSDLIAGRASRS